MGIKNLFKLIQKYSPNAITKKKINEYTGKVIGFDANLLIYKLIYAIRKNGYDLENNNIVVTHIHALLLKLIALHKYDIDAIFVFDGMMPDIKSDTVEQRNKFFWEMQQKYYKAVTQDEKKKYYFVKSNITKREVNDCIELIGIFGFKVMMADGEADGQLAYLVNRGIVNYVATEDMDILVFGGNNILKQFTVSSKKYITEISLEEVLKGFDMNQDELINLAILLGCDYCPTLKGIGTMGAYGLIKKYGSIDNIPDVVVKFDYHEVIDYFKYPPVVEIEYTTHGTVDIAKLRDYLEKHQFKPSYIQNVLNKLDP